MFNRLLFQFLAFSIFLPLGACNAGTETSQTANDTTASSFLKYEGAWFSIEYPTSFSVKPSIISNSGKGYDSVFFQSPDKNITFYICSPQWRIDCSDIKVKASETQISEEKQKTPNKLIRHFTIRANDGTYQRSYQETINADGNILWIIGLKYNSTQTLKKYQNAYQHFKRSLQQFSD